MKTFSKLLALSIFLAPIAVKATGEHKIMPSITFNTLQQNSNVMDSVHVGIEHKYEQKQGINTIVHVGGMKTKKENHEHYHAEANYKIINAKDFTYFPLVRLSFTSHSNNNEQYERQLFYKRSSVHLGIGAEKGFADILNLGIRGEVLFDLSNNIVTKMDNGSTYRKSPKSAAFRFTGVGRCQLVEYVSLEVEPYYTRCFEDRYTEIACKVGLVLNF